MNDDLEQQLQHMLHARADALPGTVDVPDGLDAAVRRTRTRKMATAVSGATLVAAAIAVAIVVPNLSSSSRPGGKIATRPPHTTSPSKTTTTAGKPSTSTTTPAPGLPPNTLPLSPPAITPGSPPNGQTPAPPASNPAAGSASLTGTIHIDKSKVTLPPDGEIMVTLLGGTSGGSAAIPAPVDPYNVPYQVLTFSAGHYQGTMSVYSDQCPGQTSTPSYWYLCTNLPTSTFTIDITPGSNTRDLTFP